MKIKCDKCGIRINGEAIAKDVKGGQLIFCLDCGCDIIREDYPQDEDDTVAILNNHYANIRIPLS